jgi:hypothetical protein
MVQHDRSERKYIYCTNRVQLLDEMEEGLLTEGIRVVHLRRDRKIVQRLVDDPVVCHELYHLLDSPLVVSLCAAQARYRRRFDPHHTHQLCEEVRRRPRYSSDLMEELVEVRVRQIMNFWRTLFRAATDEKTGDCTADWYTLSEEPIIRQLFPYLSFKCEADVRVLLVTIQKLYRGFFDGLKMVSLFNLVGEDGNRVIFMDEFDFLEANLTDLLCEDSTIREPFRFVEQFYRTMTRDRLPFPDYPVTRSALRPRIEGIVGQLDDLRAAGIPFPDLVQFTSRNEREEPLVLFQTNRTILEEPLYLEPTARSSQIVTKAERSSASSLDALQLFHTIHHVTYQILHLLVVSLNYLDRHGQEEGRGTRFGAMNREGGWYTIRQELGHRPDVVR